MAHDEETNAVIRREIKDCAGELVLARTVVPTHLSTQWVALHLYVQTMIGNLEPVLMAAYKECEYISYSDWYAQNYGDADTRGT